MIVHLIKFGWEPFVSFNLNSINIQEEILENYSFTTCTFYVDHFNWLHISSRFSYGPPKHYSKEGAFWKVHSSFPGGFPQESEDEKKLRVFPSLTVKKILNFVQIQCESSNVNDFSKSFTSELEKNCFISLIFSIRK